MAIVDWPEPERPREKLLRGGAATLSDAELLAIFLRVGVRGKSAVDLARDILSHCGSLNAVFAATEEQLCAIPGIGSAKYAQLQAVFEMARRALAEDMRAGEVLTSPDAVRDFLRLTLGNRPFEVFMVLLMDAQNRLLVAHELFRGTLTQTSVYPREVVKFALAHNAAAAIFAHNHPSGNAEPSQADEVLTRSLKQALALVDVRVLDHFIIAGTKPPFSFAERGLL
jgi:DNA repair protein RadC